MAGVRDQVECAWAVAVQRLLLAGNRWLEGCR